jgi:hypothetical protein
VIPCNCKAFWCRLYKISGGNKREMKKQKVAKIYATTAVLYRVRFLIDGYENMVLVQEA